MTTTDYTSQAQAIAEALGGSVTPQSQDCLNDNFYVALPGLDPDAQLLLRFSPYRAKGRLVVTPSFNRLGESRRGHIAAAGNYLRKDQLEQIGYASEITLALTKTAVQVAADIERRLMPGYLAALDLVRAELKKEADEEDSRDRVMQKFASIMDERWEPDNRHNHKRLIVHRTNTSAGFSVTLDLHSSNECSIDLRWINADIAEKILKVLAEHGEAKA
ncbi:hypothetical protein [Burkholderia vietnamiensis]|uniref:hypothetical protein n=1 Tax=Burkholderia vietnamiensis TaxID=60552 RepID=UPI001CB037F4|nr:hypothetical protein [Burkholderia vietnamiensis]CAG9228552.1 hypothetical protein BVI1335_70056 [Burkholderia vietnamiensis]